MSEDNFWNGLETWKNNKRIDHMITYLFHYKYMYRISTNDTYDHGLETMISFSSLEEQSYQFNMKEDKSEKTLINMTKSKDIISYWLDDEQFISHYMEAYEAKKGHLAAIEKIKNLSNEEIDAIYERKRKWVCLEIKN